MDGYAPGISQATFQSLLDELLGDPRVERSQMMGHTCAKVNGKIFVAEDDGALVVKLPRARVDEMVAAGEGERFDPLGNGRPMKEWIRIEEPDGDALSDWLALASEARAFVGTRG